MGRFVSLSDGVGYVLLLKRAAEAFEEEFEGNQRSRLCTQMRKFVTGASPESALEDKEKFAAPLRQLKDRGGKVRALGTWCDGDGFDLFVVQVVFDKDDEEAVYAYEEAFADRGDDHKERFEEMSAGEIEEKAEEWREDDDLLVFGEDDFDDG